MKWPHHNAYEFYHKIDWGGLTKKCEHEKIGPQNSDQSSFLKWPHHNRLEFYHKIVSVFFAHFLTLYFVSPNYEFYPRNSGSDEEGPRNRAFVCETHEIVEVTASQ